MAELGTERDALCLGIAADDLEEATDDLAACCGTCSLPGTWELGLGSFLRLPILSLIFVEEGAGG